MGEQAARRFREGLELFNRGEFFECHEAWEEVWAAARGPERLFLQALIHFAVGFHHHRRRNAAGASRQLRKGLGKMASYLPEYAGVDTLGLSEQVAALLPRIERGERIETFPHIGVANSTSR